ncbi:hypothetical protein Bca52824_065051 [Brassica carinata]|uniref:Uncharacterized protein n=1 Tax=Brassica carinata TaxID=52824 RepID=A0A8X7UAR6_BRACI|nr:hypothetical protein Bca52824_065051 [Brassica carinata]
MTSRRKASSKSHRDRSVPGGSSLQHGNIAPKVEFSDHSIDPEERDAYWTARGEPKRRAPGIWCPAPFPANPVEGCPNAICPNGLDAIRSFYNKATSIDSNTKPSMDAHHTLVSENRKRKRCWESRDQYGVYRDEDGFARAEDGRITHLSKEYIRAILKGAMVGHIRISLPEYAEVPIPSVPEQDIYSKAKLMSGSRNL